LAYLFYQFDADDLTWLGVALITCRDEDILRDTFVFSCHQHDAVLDYQPTDDMGVGAFQHLNNFAFAATAPIQTDFARHGSITMHSLLHFARRQVQVIAAVVGCQKAIRMAFNAAFDKVEFLHHAQVAAAVLHQLSVTLHGTQATRKQIGFVFRNAEQTGKHFRQ
jgi:hypothetical protein